MLNGKSAQIVFWSIQARSETYINFKINLVGDSPARNFFKFPRMQCAGIVFYEGLSKDALPK